MNTVSGIKAFPIVCVGGSAGALEAYVGLFQNLPADLGVAIVIINYLKNVANLLLKTLPSHTSMPVQTITEGLAIQPNHIFIIEVEREVHVVDGKFHLEAISKPTGWPNVVTVFLRSLTEGWDGQLIAVILSGYDGDGAEALCGVKQVGGITFAQKVDTAGQPDMPLSAIATGNVDFVLPVERIAIEIVRLARGMHASLSR